jgi:DNA-directed RNA polymerase specialized sigma24 family protein
MPEESLPLSVEVHIDAACTSFEAAWKAAAAVDRRPRIEDYLAAADEAHRWPLLQELLKLELEYRRAEHPSPEEYARRFPAYGYRLGPLLDQLARAGRGSAVLPPAGIAFPADAGADRRQGGVRGIPMMAPGSVTHWIRELRAGDPAAAQKLWERYFGRLVGLARQKLRTLPRRAADEEDVALSAFDSFCRGAARGRYPNLTDRDNLWHLLVTITARKALQLRRLERRQKRGGGNVRGDSAFHLGTNDVAGEGDVEQVIGTTPTPEFAAQTVEEYQRLLARLTDPSLRSVAVWKMEGYTNEEIAARLSCVPRTVQRKLGLIRTLWDQEPV